MKAKNSLGHYNKKKEAAENQVRHWRILPVLICFLLAVIIWLLVVNLTNSDYKKSSFFHPEEIEQSEQNNQTEHTVEDPQSQQPDQDQSETND